MMIVFWSALIGNIIMAIMAICAIKTIIKATIKNK